MVLWACSCITLVEGCTLYLCCFWRVSLWNVEFTFSKIRISILSSTVKWMNASRGYQQRISVALDCSKFSTYWSISTVIQKRSSLEKIGDVFAKQGEELLDISLSNENQSNGMKCSPQSLHRYIYHWLEILFSDLHLGGIYIVPICSIGFYFYITENCNY